jgi:hypothetical protein
VLGRSLGTGVLQPDNETTLAQTLYVGSTAVVCSDSGNQVMYITVTLSLPSTGAVTFQYTTTDGTAVAGTDYDATSGTYTIPADTVNAHIRVAILPQTSPSAPRRSP